MYNLEKQGLGSGLFQKRDLSVYGRNIRTARMCYNPSEMNINLGWKHSI